MLSIPGLFCVIIGFIFDLIPCNIHERSEITIISRILQDEPSAENVQDSSP